MITIKTIRYLFEAFLGLIFLIFTKILGLNLSRILMSSALSFIGPKLKITKKAKENLEIALPEISNERKEIIIFNMWKNLGMVATEFFHLSKISKEKNTRIKVEGEEIAKKYSGKGAIFVSGHFANWEIIPLILRDYRDNVGGIYRHSNNFFVNQWVVKQRAKNTTPNQIKKGSSGAREMLSLLKENGTIAMLVDQKLSSGVEVNFFGVKSMTSDGAASLALKYGYPVIPMNVEREKGSNFKVTFHDEIKINTSDNNQENIKKFTEEINKFLENCIRKKPEDWFWIHNRWDKRFNLD
jgi:KDO2-lipid IV(A) lauroyltransferase